jgi:hypothetical protein
VGLVIGFETAFDNFVCRSAQPICLQEGEDVLNGGGVAFVGQDKVDGDGKGYRKRNHNAGDTTKTIERLITRIDSGGLSYFEGMRFSLRDISVC